MKRNMMIVLAAVFAAIFLFSGMMLWQDYQDQEASAEVFDNVANLIVEETQPTTESYAEDAGTQPAEPTEPAAAEMTAYEKYAAVYAQNNDFVGWLCIEGTNINYPVMQTPEEPNYYLKRAFDHSYSDYGVPYVQENCALGISDNIVIYGHNMSNGSMFADLCRYEKNTGLSVPADVQSDFRPPTHRSDLQWLSDPSGFTCDDRSANLRGLLE